MQKRSRSKVKVIQKWEKLSCRRDSWTYREVVSPERVILTLTWWPWPFDHELWCAIKPWSTLKQVVSRSSKIFPSIFLPTFSLCVIGPWLKKKNSKQIKDAEFHSTAALRQRSDPKTNKDIKVRAFESPMSFCGLYCRKKSYSRFLRPTKLKDGKSTSEPIFSVSLTWKQI